jgi:zinc protease
MIRSKRLSLLLCVLALTSAVTAFGKAPAAKAPAAKASVVSFPTLAFHHRTLGNGLEVYTLEEHATPTVAIQVWYRVGSKNDPEGRSGFAHLFEHIMFKSTAHMKSEMFDRLTEDVGGYNNAGTYDDTTKYYEVVPSNYLETLLWAEGERLGSLNVDEANFKSERDVVKEEYRYRVLAPSYGRLYNAIDKLSFVAHPYRRPGIGSIEDLDAASVADVQSFHKTFYRPDDAVLVIAGDFDPKQLDAWVDKYLGRIPKPAGDIPRVTVKEPARTATKRYTEYAPNVPLPALAITWLIPSASDPDAPALQVAAAILSAGESSRLYHSLVYEQQLTQTADADADQREDLGLFGVLAIMASGKKIEDAESALMAELKKLQQSPPSAAELEKAKNQLITDELRERQTNDGKAHAIGQAAVIEHDAAAANESLGKLQKVTASDVQRVMKRYIGDDNRVVISYLPEPAKPGAAAAPTKGGNQ